MNRINADVINGCPKNINMKNPKFFFPIGVKRMSVEMVHGEIDKAMKNKNSQKRQLFRVEKILADNNNKNIAIRFTVEKIEKNK